jgi:hypothetical protein
MISRYMVRVASEQKLMVMRLPNLRGQGAGRLH